MNDQNQNQVAVVAANQGPRSVAELKDDVNAIQLVMRDVMKKDVHYGVIPGTGNKPTLLKPGSEKLLSTFHIAVDPIVEDLSTEDEIRYRVTCRGVHMSTGGIVGAGVGECSSSEEKYNWRAAVCPEEFEDTPEARRRIKYKQGYQGSGVQKIQQVRTDPSNQANTVLKMAKKRAEADLCLTALACSDIFAQDLEDLPSNQVNTPKAGHTAPQPAAAPPPPQPAPTAGPQAAGHGQRGSASDKQLAMVRARAFDASLTEQQMCEALGLQTLEQMNWQQVDQALEYISQVQQS